MATILAESRSETESAFQGMPSKPTDNKRTTALPHLFGPAVLVLMLIFGFIVGVTSWEGFPRTFSKFPSVAPEWNTLKELFNLQVSEYKAGLGRLDTNLSAQALLVATAVLVIVRRSDSLNFFGNSIPLSWLHVFIPILLVFLFGSFGYISHRLISGRMLGLQMAERSPHHEEYRNLFRDASWIDGWYMAFVDPNTSNISGIARDYSGFVSILLVIVLGTLIAASHASALAMVSIGCRRYFSTKQKRSLIWYYILPAAPLTFLLVCHFLFAYAGPHQNLFQPYVAVVTVVIMAFLLWLSVRIDSTSHPETLQCLRRLRQVTYSDPVARAPLRHDRSERMVALIGDSLSTSFCVGSLPKMIFRSWRAWKTNWFIGLVGNEADQSVVIRLSAYGPISATQHSSVAAMVDVEQRRSVVNHLMGTYHFRDQVDEVLSGSFPSIVLIWIGHNDVDWMSKADSLSQKTVSRISDSFVDAYEIQLRRLIHGAIASDSASAIVVFGLMNFRMFFDARVEAEALRSSDSSLFPYLEAGYKSFVSMKPQHRAGMIELATHFNRKLEAMCNRLAAQLADTKVRLVYSNAMSLSSIESAADLSPIDAWHPSLDGHRKLATCAYPAVHEQAQFLGWTKGILTVE